ncbi:uncharacterized protein LOC132631067 [Lycium barbarum]|uniref:uncharacterized protein LOC132631067 n=1 Tax=Lycium barbarum TaxID=112863 RepID=UPI00293F5BB7|nr:uncharacterized protein LOC132631067 [Lycium barbarum]
MPHIQCITVQWWNPRQGRFKCNSDGGSKGNPGPSSLAFCVRNSRGEFIHTSSRGIANTICLVAKAKAMHDGIAYCVQLQLLPLILKTDSLILMKVVDREWDVPWSIKLPAVARRLVNIDKMHLPSLRFKTFIAREPD